MANPTFSVDGATIDYNTEIAAAPWKAEFQRLRQEGKTVAEAKSIIAAQLSALTIKLLREGVPAIGKTDAEVDSEADAVKAKVEARKAARPGVSV